MKDQAFFDLFQRIIDRYELEPDIAEILLQQILEILFCGEPDDKYT